MEKHRSSATKQDRPRSAAAGALAAALVWSVLLAGCGIRDAAERGAERGARKEVGQRLDSAFGEMYGGGALGLEADAYREHVSIEVKAERLGDTPKVKLTGTVRNTGPRTVTYLNVRFSLLDEDGVQVAARTDLLAHGLSIGDNNSPVDSNFAKRFISTADNVPPDWAPGSVRCFIEEIAIK